MIAGLSKVSFGDAEFTSRTADIGGSHQAEDRTRLPVDPRENILKKPFPIPRATRPRFLVKAFVAGFGLLCAAVLFAQEAGSSAGGKWKGFDSQDEMTLVKKARFELDADNSLPGSESNPKIILFCTAGKLDLADFRPNARIAGPDRPSFWGRPQMGVLVRVDNSHSNHAWNWVNGHFLSMDKGTTREMLGAQVFKVEIQTPQGSEITSFSPAGINLDRVKKACGLTPKKP
jgi:hypothetical protein